MALRGVFAILSILSEKAQRPGVAGSPPCAPRMSSRCHVANGMLRTLAKCRSDMRAHPFAYPFHAVPGISRRLSVRCSPALRLMMDFLLPMASIFRVTGCAATPVMHVIHDFPGAAGFLLLPFAICKEKLQMKYSLQQRKPYDKIAAFRPNGRDILARKKRRRESLAAVLGVRRVKA